MKSGIHIENCTIFCKRKISCYIIFEHNNLVTSSNQS